MSANSPELRRRSSTDVQDSSDAAADDGRRQTREDGYSLDEVDVAARDPAGSGHTDPVESADDHSPTRSNRDSPLSVTYSDDGVETLVTDHCQALTDRLKKLTNELKASHFKEYTGLADLQSATKHITSHMKYNEMFIASMVAAIHETSASLDMLNSTIVHKVQEEQLQTWLDRPINIQDVAEQAGSYSLMSKAAELRETVANVELQLANVSKLCADLELATVEAQQMAVQAQQSAEEAARRAEAAERATQEKARAEEEKRKKAEDLAKRQTEEERKRKEMEEKRRAEMDMVKGTPEEQERINPNNWPSYTFKWRTANEFDGSYGCVIRSMPGVLAQSDVTVDKVSQLDSGLSLDNNDELVGNIIIIEPAEEHSHLQSAELSLEAPLSVLIPHCAPRSTSKEIVVLWRQFQDSSWVPLEAKECNIDTVKDAKLVECRPSGFGVFAVVQRLKTDTLTITKKGGKFVSSVDSRLCVQCRPGAFRVNTNFTLQIQPVDLASVSDVKARFSEDCGGLISSSPIVNMTFPTPTLNRPISIITPIPANSSRPKRPTTAVDKERSKPASRPASAFGLGSYSREDDGEDELHLLAQNNEGQWCILADLMEYSPQNKKGDLICVNTKIIPNKFWLLRTKARTTAAQVETLANRLYDYLHKRVIQLIMRQKTDDPTDIALVCTTTQRLDRTIRKLDDDGYTDGTKISQEVFVREGQKIEVRFRGNLQPDEEVDLVLAYNSQLKNQVNMYIAEIDKYAQKSFNSYRGFAQFYIEGMVTKDIYEETDKKKGDQRKPIGTEEVWDSVQLAELLISLPKPEPEAPKPLKKAKLHLMSEGPIDENLLKQLSTDLGDEWKMLATHLNVKKTRIQSIMRNHVNSENEAAVHEMLLTWIKRVPRCMDKVKVLCEALKAVGRLDLVEDVKDKEYDYKEQRAEQLKESLLKQIFIKIAQHPAVLSRWKELAEYLRISDRELTDIENEYSKGRERCLQVLQAWKRNQDDDPSPNQLIRAIKHLRLNDLTGEIRRMVYH